MPSRSPTSSFERPAAINSTTSRCRSVIFSSRSFSTCAMTPTLTTAWLGVHWPKGVFRPNTPRGVRSGVALCGGVLVGNPVRHRERPCLLNELAHLVGVDRPEIHVHPVVPHVVLARERELLGLGLDERVAPVLRERETHRRAVARDREIDDP